MSSYNNKQKIIMMMMMMMTFLQSHSIGFLFFPYFSFLCGALD